MAEKTSIVGFEKKVKPKFYVPTDKELLHMPYAEAKERIAQNRAKAKMGAEFQGLSNDDVQAFEEFKKAKEAKKPSKKEESPRD